MVYDGFHMEFMMVEFMEIMMVHEFMEFISCLHCFMVSNGIYDVWGSDW